MPSETLVGLDQAQGSGNPGGPKVGTAPPPGSQILEVVPAGKQWRLQTLIATLTTTGGGAPRVVRFTVEGPGGILLGLITEHNTQLAGTVARYVQAATGLPVSSTTIGAGTFDIFITLPVMLFLASGMRLRTSVLNMDPADQWSAPVIMVEEWPIQ